MIFNLIFNLFFSKVCDWCAHGAVVGWLEGVAVQGWVVGLADAVGPVAPRTHAAPMASVGPLVWVLVVFL